MTARLHIACLVWLTCVVGGHAALWRYATHAGAVATIPRTWPTESSLSRDPVRATLVAFVHPRCPCSSATISELGRILATAGQRVRASVVLACPTAAAGRGNTPLEAEARALGVEVRKDAGVVEARRFGAVTSGAVVVYAPDGELLYGGGITQARGHVGENRGGNAVIAALTALAPAPTAPVFGCPLDNCERP